MAGRDLLTSGTMRVVLNQGVGDLPKVIDLVLMLLDSAQSSAASGKLGEWFGAGFVWGATLPVVRCGGRSSTS